MKERPILFSNAMVDALLHGHKTQTRRIVNTAACISTVIECPYGRINDKLWVRETFAIVDNVVKYKVDNPKLDTKWKASIFMPRTASRILLEITNIKVEKLNSISHVDAKREGLTPLSKDGVLTKYGIPDKDGYPGKDNWGWDWCNWNASPEKAYKFLWERINGEGSWDVNPYVWVITFKIVEVKK